MQPDCFQPRCTPLSPGSPTPSLDAHPLSCGPKDLTSMISLIELSAVVKKQNKTNKQAPDHLQQSKSFPKYGPSVHAPKCPLSHHGEVPLSKFEPGAISSTSPASPIVQGVLIHPDKLPFSVQVPKANPGALHVDVLGQEVLGSRTGLDGWGVVLGSLC